MINELRAASDPNYPPMIAEDEGDDVDLSTVHLPLEPGRWCDADERMLMACFTILGQFVEQELGPSLEEPESDGGSLPREEREVTSHRGYRVHCYGGTDEQAIDLWLWYRDELPALEKQADEDPSIPFRTIDELKDRKLRSLIDIRQTLWT